MSDPTLTPAPGREVENSNYVLRTVLAVSHKEGNL
jgi:hypothetical protein